MITNKTPGKVDSESSSTDTNQKVSRGKSHQDSFDRNRKKLHRKSPEAAKQSGAQKAISKPVEAVKNNIVDSKSDSSSSNQCRINNKSEQDKITSNKSDEEKATERNGSRLIEKGDVHDRMRCSPSIDLSTNPNVTFVSNSSIPELR